MAAETLALKRIIRTYPEWTIAREGDVWTATRRPTATELHFIYGVNLDLLACKLRREDSGLARRSQMMQAGICSS